MPCADPAPSNARDRLLPGGNGLGALPSMKRIYRKHSGAEMVWSDGMVGQRFG